MQQERVQIIAKQMVQKNDKTVYIVPHPSPTATVNDITGLFGKYMMDSVDTGFPVLTAAFRTLKHTSTETLFVFVKRYQNEVLGIIRTQKVLFSLPEIALLKQTGQENPYNYPLFTFKEYNVNFEAAMEQLCRNRDIQGPCYGVFCYR
jgi:hypothetical protein